MVIDSRQAKPSAEDLTRAINALDAAGVRVTKTNANVGASMDRMAAQSNAAAANIRRGLIATFGGLSAMGIIDVADEWGQYASRIKMATRSTEEYSLVQERMLQSANTTFRHINETRESFIQLSPVMRDLGLSLEQSMDAVDAFSGLLVVNAANGERAAAAMRAISLSMQKGKIDATSWITIYSTLDSLVGEIAASTGDSAEEIRKLGSEGKLSIETLVRVLADRYPEIIKQVEAMPTSVRDAMNTVSNAFTEYVGKANEANGVTAALADGIKYLGDNLGGVLDAALVVSGGVLAAYTAKMGIAGAQAVQLAWAKARDAAASVNSAAASRAFAAAKVAEAQAAVAAATGMQRLTIVQSTLVPAQAQLSASTRALAVANNAFRSSLMGLVGGPVGALTLGLTVAGAAWALFSNKTDEAKSSLLNIEGSLESTVAQFEKMGEVSRRSELAKVMQQQKEAADEADRAFQQLASSMRVGMFDNYDDWLKYRNALDEARSSGSSLAPVLDAAAKAAGVPPDAVARWLEHAKAVEVADGKARAFTPILEALKGVVDRLSGSAKGAGDALAALTPEQYASKTSEWLGKYATDAEKLSAKLAEARKEFGGLIPPEVEKRIRAAFAPRGGGLSSQISEGQRYIDQINERISLIGKETELEKLQAQISVGAIKFKTQAKREEAEAAAKALDKASASAKLTEMQREIDMIGLVTEADKMRYEVSKGLYAGFEPDFKKRLVSLAAESDAKSRQIDFNKTLLSLQGERTDAERQFFREIEAFGRGDQYRGLLDSLAQIEDKYRHIMRERRNSPAGLTAGEQAAIERARDAELERERERYAERLALQTDWVSGATRGLENYFDSARNVSSGIEGLFGNAFSGMEDALTTFVRTGKASFSDLANSIIDDMIRITIQQSITGPLASALGGAVGSYFGSMSSNWSSTNTSNPWSLGSMGLLPNAKGGVYDSPSLSQYSGGIYDTPQLFAFAKGAGVFGEAGPEAIMPLRRGRDGTLGVRAELPVMPAAQMPGAAGQPQIKVNIYGVQSQPESVTATRNQSGGFDIDIMFKQLEKRIAGNVASGQGSMSKALERRYALTPQLG